MKRFTYVIMPGEREYSVVGQDQAHAHSLLWQSLSFSQRDNVSYMECVDEEPATQDNYDRQLVELFGEQK